MMMMTPEKSWGRQERARGGEVVDEGRKGRWIKVSRLQIQNAPNDKAEEVTGSCKRARGRLWIKEGEVD